MTFSGTDHFLLTECFEGLGRYVIPIKGLGDSFDESILAPRITETRFINEPGDAHGEAAEERSWRWCQIGMRACPFDSEESGLIVAIGENEEVNLLLDNGLVRRVKMNSLKPNIRRGFINDCASVQHIPRKGLGVVAETAIKKGSRILAEDFILTAQEANDDYNSQLKMLPAFAQDEFWSLTDCVSPEGKLLYSCMGAASIIAVCQTLIIHGSSSWASLGYWWCMP